VPSPLPDDGEPPVYALFQAQTVRDAWREWREGINSGPSLAELEERWGSRWRPKPAQKIAFCRRKVLINRILQLTTEGITEDEAVEELERCRAGRSLRKLITELTAQAQSGRGRKRARGMACIAAAG
jgi:hypothetical protein